jgi:hypothetical protein
MSLFVTSRPLKVVEVHVSDAHCFLSVAEDKNIELHIPKEISRGAELLAVLGSTANAAWRDEIVTTIKKNAEGRK